MQYRTLGKTNLRVSVVGIGTWQYGGEWGMDFSQSTVDAIFDKGRDLGVNLVDTAECYGDHTSEAFVGNAIQRDRDKWIVATKFGHVFHSPFNRSDERSAKDVRAQVTKSLVALKTDFLDLLQYHSVRDNEFTDEAVRDELTKLVTEGKVRHIGNSLGSAAITAEGHNPQAELSEKFNVSALQVIYNRLDRRPDIGGSSSVFATAKNQNLGILARVPLASGLLSGKYKPGTVFSDSDVRGKWKDPNLEAKLVEVQQIARDEVPAGVDMAAWALGVVFEKSGGDIGDTGLQECRAAGEKCGGVRAAPILRVCNFFQICLAKAQKGREKMRQFQNPLLAAARRAELICDIGPELGPSGRR